MDTTTKIHEIFEKAANNCIELQSGINSETNSYEFEKAFRKEMSILEQKVYQEIVGGIEGTYLQEQMCRAGRKM